MIIVQLNGGLGNQMFQYAVGRSLSIKRKEDLFLDISLYKDKTSKGASKRSYELNKFGIDVRIAEEALLSRVISNSSFSHIQRMLKKIVFNSKNNNNKILLIKEKNFVFDSSILDLTYDVYLSGYWQSEKYFKNIKSYIVEDFNNRVSPISTQNRLIADLISNTNSVSLHVRRTDYITNPIARDFHGVCTSEYYYNSMKYIESRIKNPTYFVFTDEHEWARRNINSKHKIVFVENNHGNDSHEDMRLMKICKNNIIANSSFSWWGAWLNQNKSKIVVSPKQWFIDHSIRTSDLIPKSWIKL